MFDKRNKSLKACLSWHQSLLCLLTTTDDYVPINDRSNFRETSIAMILDFFLGSLGPIVGRLQVQDFRLNINCICVRKKKEVRLSKSMNLEIQLNMQLKAWELTFLFYFWQKQIVLGVCIPKIRSVVQCQVKILSNGSLNVENELQGGSFTP